MPLLPSDRRDRSSSVDCKYHPGLEKVSTIFEIIKKTTNTCRKGCLNSPRGSHGAVSHKWIASIYSHALLPVQPEFAICVQPISAVSSHCKNQAQKFYHNNSAFKLVGFGHIFQISILRHVIFELGCHARQLPHSLNLQSRPKKINEHTFLTNQPNQPQVN